MKGLFGVFGCKISKFRPTSERLPPDFFDFRQPSALLTHYYICKHGAGAAFSRTHVKHRSGPAARHCDAVLNAYSASVAGLRPQQRSRRRNALAFSMLQEAASGLAICRLLLPRLPPFAGRKAASCGHPQTCWMVQSCSTDSLSLKYLSSSAVRVDNKCLFSCVCSEFVFMTF